MSQFPSAPPPGAINPPNQSTPPAQGFNQQQPQYGYGPQAPSQYGQPAPTYGPPASSHKPTNAFGSVLNQAVTQGKPMLNKLGKTISSKLGSKQSSHATPQHLESYQNYQQHQQQNQPQGYQAQGQQFSPQPQQQQSAYQTQQSPFPQSQYGTSASGNSGQSNYLAQQAPQSPNPQAPPQQPNSPGYNQQGFVQGGNPAGQPQAQPAQGQFNTGQAQGMPQPTQVGQASGQQTGVIGSSQIQSQNMNAQAPPSPNVVPNASTPAGSQQQRWTPPTPAPNQATSPVPQQSQTFNPTPPPQQYNAAPPLPVHPNQHQPQQLQQQPQQQQQQHWTPVSPVSPQVQMQNQIPPSVSPPPQPSGSQQNQPLNPKPQQQPQTQPSTLAPQNQPPQAAQTEFIAELPADMSNLTIMESSKPQRPPSNPPTQGSAYQAYRPPGSGKSPSPTQGFAIPRRAVSTSSLSLTDPWRYADPTTELPTREFYILADLLFDALDRKFEPQNTGLLEASKVLESWKVTQGLEEQAAQLFAYDSFTAFAKLWSLEGVPHIMVPCLPSLMPIWNFQQQSHSQEMRMPAESTLANATYPTYMPALNRASWYKQFFLDVMQDPEGVEKLFPAICCDAYKPGTLNQPDFYRRDKTELPALASRAKAICTAAVTRACQDVAAQMQGNYGGAAQAQPAQPSGGMSQQEAALKLQSLQIQQQLNNMMNKNMVQGGVSFSSAAGNTYKPNYGSFV